MMKSVWIFSPVPLVLVLCCAQGAAQESVETVDVVEQAGSPGARTLLKPVHAALMGLCTLQLLASMLIARRRTRDKFWLPKHQTLGFVSPLLLLVAAGVAIGMVQLTDADHLSVPHAWVGLSAGVLILILPVLGFSILRLPGRAASLRPLHAWIGRIALLLLLAGCISGLLM